MEHILKIIVEEQYLPATAGRILQIQAGLTRHQISSAKFRPGGITRNGIQCRVTESVLAGDTLSIRLEDSSPGSSHLQQPSEILPPLRVLYEDRDVLAVDKPSGLVTHPSGKHYNDSLSNQVYWYLHQKNEEVTVHSIGRLDRETSGVVIFAKNKTSAARLQAQNHTGDYRKEYLAVLSGFLPANSQHTVQQPIGPDPDDPRKRKAFSHLDRIPPECQSAITHFQVLYGTPEWSLVSLILDTGRTHQIRVHMKALGHPLIGDTLYGLSPNPSFSFHRAALHAWHVSFIHPFKNNRIFLESALPEDFSPLEKYVTNKPVSTLLNNY